MFKFLFLVVTYGIAFLIIGVCLRKLIVNGDFISLFNYLLRQYKMRFVTPFNKKKDILFLKHPF